MSGKISSMVTKMTRSKGILFLLSCVAVLTLHCRFEIFVGGFPESAFLNGLDKLYNTFFAGLDFLDLAALTAVYIMLLFVAEKDQKIDISSLILALIMAITLIASVSFKKFNSSDFMFANSYQILATIFCAVGFCVIIYSLLRCVHYFFDKKLLVEEKSGNSFVERHFLKIGFCVIFAGWMPWIIMNYPGSGCPDSVLQLQEFFGVETWGAGHPPLSTVIMGSLVTLGDRFFDINFGFFLYCFLQTCVGAWVFSLSMKKLHNIGIPLKWCAIGIAYFAFTPLWGTYAQWVEKDLLYAEIAVLQTICMMEIMIKRQCSKKDAVLLAISSLLAVFLRNNGIHAILPALLLLAVWFKGVDRRRIAAVLLVTLVTYEGIVKGLYPALGIQGISIIESLSVPFQQTGRYVCEHPDEVTEYERQVLDTVFGYENLFNYDPVISDPIKIRCRAVNMPEYFKVWFQMFFKHPNTYVAAFINKGYGYLAPVSQNIEAWINLKYYDYMTEIGLHHVFDVSAANVLVQIWNLSMTLPLVKYLCTPGLYTWIVAVLAFMLAKRRRYSALILFVPSFMNILVCLASPLASAIRYELPAVASVPLLIGWVCFSVGRQQSKTEGVR